MLNLTVRPQARKDLREIWSYTHRRWSREQANHYLAKLNASISELRERAELGRPCDEIAKGLMRRVVERHTVYFRVVGNRLLIVRVLHVQMDPASHLANDDT